MIVLDFEIRALGDAYNIPLYLMDAGFDEEYIGIFSELDEMAISGTHSFRLWLIC